MLLEVMEGVTLRGASVGATWKTSMNIIIIIIMYYYYIPALGVVNIISDTTSILLPNTLNVVVTVTV